MPLKDYAGFLIFTTKRLVGGNSTRRAPLPDTAGKECTLWVSCRYHQSVCIWSRSSRGSPECLLFDLVSMHNFAPGVDIHASPMSFNENFVYLTVGAKNRMSEFVDSLEEVFVLFGRVNAKRMFGGYGIYHSDLMFGLVADDVLYLKADEESAAAFSERGLRPFEYEKNGKKLKMSYYLAPEEIFDDLEIAKVWGIRAFEAALRGRKPKPRKAVNRK